MADYILTLLIFLPFLGLIFILLIPGEKAKLYKWIALTVTLVQLVISGVIFFSFDAKFERSYQFVEQVDWIFIELGSLGKLSIQYFLGVDGINLLMVLISAIVLLIGVLASWNITKYLKGYFSLYMILSTSIFGSFLALDLFLFYLFFEFMLLPMYFLIGVWGGPRKAYAAIKFFLYTLLGSILILIVFIGLYISAIDPVKTAELASYSNVPVSDIQDQIKNQLLEKSDLVHTFNLIHLQDVRNFLPGSIFSLSGSFFGMHARWLGFLLLFAGFAIKLPAVPVHTWLPDAHVEAPTAISVVLAGVLLKVGGYGFFRFAYGIFPDGGIHYAWLVGILGVIAIIYGGLSAMGQKDIKRLIAYSSISHMGFVSLGIAALTTEAVSGALFQLFSHGIISAALFVIAGVIYSRTGDRLIENYSGLAAHLPAYTLVVVITFFASLGLPGLSGFIGEILVFLGSFKSQTENGLIPESFTIIAASGLVITAAYYLWTLQRMFFGKYWVREEGWMSKMKDLTVLEKIIFIPLIIMMLVFGIFPQILLDPIAISVSEFIQTTLQRGNQYLMGYK
ncbi:MAG TPA: NuoM family protein [Cyclobacteriaceae bacterium]